jgi:periplasmic protein TonB
MNHKLIVIVSLTFLTLTAYGQKTDKARSDTMIYVEPMVPPSFPGGQIGLTEYIKKNFNWNQGQLTVEGTVWVGFWVDVDGKVEDVKIVRGLCESCDKEALRLVKNMPTWIAGTENGKVVKTKMALPIKFGL